MKEAFFIWRLYYISRFYYKRTVIVSPFPVFCANLAFVRLHDCLCYGQTDTGTSCTGFAARSSFAANGLLR